MFSDLIPIAFLLFGGGLRLRLVRLRAQRRPDTSLLEVASAFALGAGAFLLALTVMCRP